MHNIQEAINGNSATVELMFGDVPVRMVERDGETWWIAADVCDVLDLENSRKAVSGLDDDELTSLVVTSGGQRREMNAVNESGLYALIFKSRKPNAQAFRRWVTHEVLPSIRRTGGYQAKAPARVSEYHIVQLYELDDCWDETYMSAVDFCEKAKIYGDDMREFAQCAGYWCRAMHKSVAVFSHTKRHLYPIEALLAVQDRMARIREEQRWALAP